MTTDDLEALVRWQAMFGPGFRSVLVFAYAEPIRPFPLPSDNGAYEFRGREYRFWAVGLDDYIAHLRSRGPAWKAVAMARRQFRRRVRPLREWLPMTHESGRRPLPRQGARTMTGPAPSGPPGGSPPCFWPSAWSCRRPPAPTARAQEEAPAGGESKGDPVPGYLGAGLLTMLVLFIVGKSARR